MENFKVVLFLLAVLISLSALTDKLKIPNPIVLVVAGLLIGFIPFLPDLTLDPDIVFLIFLPPILFDAALRTSWHDFRSDIRPISALAISLVFFTTTAVAVTAYILIPNFTWALAFLLGAIISPPDAVAATGIMRGLSLNKRVMTILEGESLVNDASALIAYRYALAAVMTGSFVFWKAGAQFLLVTIGGLAIGFVIGYLLVFLHKKITSHSLVETSLTLMAPFIAYLVAEEVHVSGILAVVTAGLIISWRSPEVFTYQTRMRTRIVWDTIIFLLNGFIFILIGLQLPAILKQLTNYSTGELVLYSVAISLVTVFVRILWVFSGAYLTRVWKSKTDAEGADEPVPWKHVLIIAWTGTRGVISLATALALPIALYSGKVFPERNLILFLSFVVIFFTLVVQGLSLPFLIKWLNVKPDISESREQKELQLYMVNNTLHFIEKELPVRLEDAVKKQLQKKYEAMAVLLTKEIYLHRKNEKKQKPAPLPIATPLLNAQVAITKFQRELLIRLHKEGAYSDTAIKEVEREMDINEMKLDQQLPKEEDNNTIL